MASLPTFSVASVTQLTLSTLKLTFTDAPLAYVATGTSDALNTQNYTISGGPAPLIVVQVIPFPDDPKSIKLYLSGQMAAGTWTVAVRNVIAATGSSLTTATVRVTIASTLPGLYVAPNFVSQSASDTIRSHLTPAMEGPATNALISALAVGDKYNNDNAALAFDQLFVSSASGIFLDRKVADNGVIRPSEVGMSDDSFRQLAIKTTANKIVGKAYNDTLEVFYGTDATHGFALSAAEPFVLTDQDSVSFLLDEKDAVTVVFKTADFANIASAKAAEVAAAITRAFKYNGLKAYAIPFNDTSTNTIKVKVYSSMAGLGSSIRITNGKAQNVLQFPTPLTALLSGSVGPWLPTWTVSQPTPGTTRFTAAGTLNLYVSTENFKSAAYSANDFTSDARVIVTDNAVTSPIGTAAQSVQVISGDFVFAGQYIVANGGSYTFSMWVRSLSGTQSTAILIFDFTSNLTLAGTTVTATTTWTKYTYTTTTTAGHRIAGLWYPAGAGVGLTGTSAGWGLQFEQGTTASAYVPSSITAATATLSGFYTITGGAIRNVLLQSNALGTAPWIPNGNVPFVANNTADPMNGAGLVSNTAGTLTGNGTSNGAMTGQQFVANGGPYTFGMWVLAVSPSSFSFNLAIRDITSGTTLVSTGFTATTTWQFFNVSVASTVFGHTCEVDIFPNANSLTMAVWHALLQPSAAGSGIYAIPSVASSTSLGVTGNGCDLSQVRISDYVNIDGGFNTNNKGSFSITNIGSSNTATGLLSQFFEIANTLFTGQTVTQAAVADLLFYRPTRNTAQTVANRTVIEGGSVDVVLPATTSIVQRTRYSGAYTQVNASVSPNKIVRSGSTIVLTTQNAHNLTTGNWVFLDNASPTISVPAINTGSSTFTASSFSTFAQTLTSSPLTTAVARHTMAFTTVNGVRQVTIFGGFTGTGNAATANIVRARFSGTSTASDGTIKYGYTVAASAGSLPVASGGHASLVLPNGIAVNGGFVMNTGGMSAGVASGTVSYFNPAGDSVTSGVSLNTARYFHTATVLSTNKVLVAGGATGASPTTACELYDPALNSSANTGSLNVARCDHGAVLLRTGNVLVFGGKTAVNTSSVDTISYTPISSCELFTGASWTVTGKMTFARYGFGYTVLPNGNVFVVGGYSTDETQGAGVVSVGTNTCELYDVNTGRWSVVGRTSQTYAWPTVSQVGNLIYIFGSVGAHRVVDIFNIDTQQFQIAPFQWVSGIYQLPAVPITFSDGTAAIFTAGGRGGAFSTQNGAQLMISASPQYAAGRLNAMYPITVTGSTTFTVPSDAGYSNISTANYTVVTAGVDTIPGPYLYDPKAGIGGITASETSLTTAITAGIQLKSLTVADATLLADANGYLVVGYGNDYVAGPIAYYGRQSSTTIIIDYSYTFPKNIPSGAKVTLLVQKSPWVPTSPQSVGSFYLTSSNSGRITASSFIDSIAAAGVSLTKTVQYPNDYGLGNFGAPTSGAAKLTDAVRIWGSDGTDDLGSQ
jgi:hypothetical protein